MKGKLRVVPVIVALSAMLIVGLMTGCSSPTEPRIDMGTVFVPIIDRAGQPVLNVAGEAMGLRVPTGSLIAQAYLHGDIVGWISDTARDTTEQLNEFNPDKGRWIHDPLQPEIIYRW